MYHVRDILWAIAQHNQQNDMCAHPVQSDQSVRGPYEDALVP